MSPVLLQFRYHLAAAPQHLLHPGRDEPEPEAQVGIGDQVLHGSASPCGQRALCQEDAFVVGEYPQGPGQ